MPQWIDLSKPETILAWPDPKVPYMPWNWNTAVKGPAGSWLIDFMEKVNRRRLNYTLSAWWRLDKDAGPKVLRQPQNHREGAEMWVTMLHEWKRRFGFDGLVYVDLANEVPYFFPGLSRPDEKGNRLRLVHGAVLYLGPGSIYRQGTQRRPGPVVPGISRIEIHGLHSWRRPLAGRAGAIRLPRCPFLRRRRLPLGLADAVSGIYAETLHRDGLA